MTLNPKKGFLVNFSQFLDAAHISTLNCDKMAGDRPGQPAYDILALNVDFSSPSPDPIGSRMLAQASVKDGYPLPKKWLFTAVGSCSVKTVADRYRHAAYHKHW